MIATTAAAMAATVETVDITVLTMKRLRSVRSFEAGEFMDICKFLGKNPLDFYQERDADLDAGQDSA